MRVIPFTSPLTDEEAREILNIRDGVNEDNRDFNTLEGRPHWYQDGEYFMVLDGGFTREELLALLHFHPENKDGV